MNKAILVGCGSMARAWVDYVQQRADTEIVGLVDIREESARQMADRYALQVPIFTELEKALSSTDANLVLDITIPESHKQVVTTALLHGCHIFGEKPMATSIEDARELTALAKKTGKLYAIMQNYRFIKEIRSLHQALEAGVIGTVNALHADFFLGPRFGGFRDQMDYPLILDMSIHTFDQARFLLGADPVSVYCQSFNPSSSWYQGDASAVCIFEMSNGSVFSYRGSWCSEGFPTSWRSDWRVVGSSGTALWDGAHQPVCEVVDGPGGTVDSESKYRRVEIPQTWTGADGHHGCFDNMFDALAEQRQPETVCTDNLKSTAMVFGAIESAKSGKKITL